MTANLWALGDHERAVECGERAFAISSSKDLEDSALRALSPFFLGRAYFALGDYRRARDFLDRSVRALGAGGNQERLGRPYLPGVLFRAWLVWSLAELGEFPQGIAYGEEAVRIADATGRPYDVIVAHLGIGGLYLVQGDLDRAITVLERGLVVCRAENIPLLLVSTTARLGYAYVLAGRTAEGLPLLEGSVEEATSKRVLLSHSQWVGWLGEAFLLAGRLDEAARLAAEALELSRKQKDRGNHAWALRLLGEIARSADLPDAASAIHFYREAMELAETLGMQPLLAHCHLGLAALHRRLGALDEGRRLLSVAADLYSSMSMMLWWRRAATEAATIG
jgi:tetratricopeptide (TPR) repeat protein